MHVSGILLAAGASARFGSQKMLAPVGEKGTPLLLQVRETWLEAGIRDLLIVLGSHAGDIRAAFEEDLLRRVNTDRDSDSRSSARFVENPLWESGMFTSVKAGLVAASPTSTHFAISPADLPFLSKSSLRTILAAAASLDARTVVVPTHDRRRGHPLVVPAALRERILSWPDDTKLSRIFGEPDLEILHLEGFDDSILRDVDTPGDLARRAI